VLIDGNASTIAHDKMDWVEKGDPKSQTKDYIHQSETLECLKINTNHLLSDPGSYVMTYICAKLISVAHANRYMKSHWMYIFVYFVLYLKTVSLSSLKIMKKSPITEYSDGPAPNQESWWVRGYSIAVFTLIATLQSAMIEGNLQSHVHDRTRDSQDTSIWNRYQR